MKKISNYLLPIQTKDLYAKEAVSSISLAHEVTDKINEIVDYLNAHEDITSEKILEQDGKIRKGIIYMKDNLANTIHDLLELMKANGEVDDLIANVFSKILKRVVCVNDYGAYGDGIHDDTLAIQRAIEENEFATIYIPKGNYKISRPIKTTCSNTKQQNIILDKNAIIFTNEELDCLFELGGLGGTSDGVDLRYRYFKGGILDANNCISGIKINPNLMGVDISDTEIRNFTKYGVYVPRDKEGSSDISIHDTYINGKTSSDDNYGLYLQRPDNKFYNLRVNAVKTGVYMDRGGQFLENVHGLYITYTSELPDSFIDSKFIHFAGGSDVFVHQCYCDTFHTFVYSETSSPIIITDSFFYSYIKKVDIELFKFKNHDAKYTIKNNTFNMPSAVTKHKGIVYENFNIQYMNDNTCIVEDNHINKSASFTPGDLITKCDKSYTPYWLNTVTTVSSTQWLKVGYMIPSFKYNQLKINIDGYEYVVKGKLTRSNGTTTFTPRIHTKDNNDISINVGFKFEGNTNGYDVYGVYIQHKSGVALRTDIEVQMMNEQPLMRMSFYPIDKVFVDDAMDSMITI